VYDIPAARAVLWHCEFALEKFRKEQPEGDNFRHHYFLNVVLLRTVAEVLFKIDKYDQNLHENQRNCIEAFRKDLANDKPKYNIY
jgi:hypothetical protein